MKKLLVIAICSIGMMACEKDLDYELPREDPKITIDARVIVGEPVKAWVGSTEYVLSSDEPSLLPGADVSLLEDGVAVDQLTQNSFPGYQYYFGDYIPKAGHTYRIRVEHPDFKTAVGEDVTRPEVPITVVVNTQQDSILQTITVGFNDPGESEDYYLIRAYNINQGEEYYTILGTTDPLVDFFYSFDDDLFPGDEAYGDKAFLSDEIFNGKYREVRFKTPGFFNGAPQSTDTIIVELTRLSEDFYKHEKSRGIQSTNGDNPFAEPVQVYSNIVNGYGIVAAGSRSRRIITR